MGDFGQVAQMVAGAVDGDQAAWDALVARYEGMVWNIVRSHRLADADARDVFQTTWLRLVEHLGRLRDPGAVGSWLAVTAKRECWRVARHSQRSVTVSDEHLELLDDHSAISSVSTRLLDDERDRALWDAIDALRERCRVLLRAMATDPAPSYDEIAALIEIPVGSIGPTRRRCLDNLREQLAARGITADAIDS